MQTNDKFDALNKICRNMQQNATELAHYFQQEANEQQQQLIGLIKDQTIRKQTNDALCQYKQLIEDFKQLYEKLNVSDKFTRIPKLPTCGQDSKIDKQLENEQKNTIENLISFHQTCTDQLNMQKIDDLATKLENQEMASQVLVQQIQQLRNEITDFLEDEGIAQLPRFLQQFLKCTLEENLIDLKIDKFVETKSSGIANYKHQTLIQQLELINTVLGLLKKNCSDSGNRLKLVYQCLEKQSQCYMQHLLDVIKDGVQDINNNLPPHLQLEINEKNITIQLYKKVIQIAEQFLQDTKNVEGEQKENQSQSYQSELNGIKLNFLMQRLKYYYDKRERQVDINQTIHIIQFQEQQENNIDSQTGQLQMSQLGPLALQDQIHQYATQELELKNISQGLRAYTQYMEKLKNDPQKSFAGCIEQLKLKAEEYDFRIDNAFKNMMDQLSPTQLNEKFGTQSISNQFSQIVTGQTIAVKPSNQEDLLKLLEARDKFYNAIQELESVQDIDELQFKHQELQQLQDEAKEALFLRIQQCSHNIQALQIYEADPYKLIKQYLDHLMLLNNIRNYENKVEALHQNMVSSSYQKLQNSVKSFKQSKEMLSRHLGKLLRQMGVLQGIIQLNQLPNQHQLDEITSDSKKQYIDVANQLSNHFIKEKGLNLALVKELGNRLNVKLSDKLKSFKLQLESHHNAQNERKDLVGDYIESLKQYYQERLESPNYKFLLDTYAQIARTRAQHALKQTTYAAFCKFNECADGFNQMYQEDLFSHQLRLKTLVLKAKQNIEETSPEYANSSQYLKTPSSLQKRTQNLTQTPLNINRRLSGDESGLSIGGGQIGGFGVTNGGVQSSLSLGIFKNPLIQTLHDRNINDLFTSKQKQKQIQIQLNELNARSNFVQMYEKINRFKHIIDSNYDFTELLVQLEKRIAQIELLANNAVERSRDIFQETKLQFYTKKEEIASQLYTKLFETLTQIKTLSWHGALDQSGIQEATRLQNDVNQIRKNIISLQEANVEELDLKLNEDIDQMLDEQDQLNRILRTKYIDTAIEENSEPELIIDSFNNNYTSADSIALRNQHSSYEIENITPQQVQIEPQVIKQVVLNDSKQNMNQLIINTKQTTKAGGNLKNLKKPIQEQRQVQVEPVQIQEEQIISAVVHPDIQKILNQEVQVNRLVSQGMMPYEIELINPGVLKLNSVKQGKLTQIKIQNIKTVRQRFHTEHGIRYACLDIYLNTTQQVVFAFTNEKLCKIWVQGIRACVEGIAHSQ